MKIRFTVTCFALTMVCTALAQHFSGAVNMGINALQVDGDEAFGYHKAGLNIGPSAVWSFNDQWSVSLETIYNQKGSKQRPRHPTVYNPDSGAYQLNLRYLEVPILVHFNDHDRLTFGTGFSWGRLTQAKEWENGHRVITTSKAHQTYHPSDWNVLVDIRFRLAGNFWLNARYAYSMASVRTRTFPNGRTREQYNNLLTFRLIYQIERNSD